MAFRPNHDILVIRRPNRIVQQTKIFFRHRLCIRAVAMHHPNIIAARAVAGETDFFSIRTETRLNFKRRSAAEQFGLAAGAGQNINITQQIKNDFFAVGTDVEIHPRAFGRRKFC